MADAGARGAIALRALDPGDRYLSVAEACRYLACKKSWLYAMMAAGEVAYDRVGSKRWIRRSTLIAYCGSIIFNGSEDPIG